MHNKWTICDLVIFSFRAAKQQQLRIWKGYQPSSSSSLSQGSRNFSGRVVEVVNGDALVIKKGDQQYQKIWFSSIRPPRLVKFSCWEARSKCV